LPTQSGHLGFSIPAVRKRRKNYFEQPSHEDSKLSGFSLLLCIFVVSPAFLPGLRPPEITLANAGSFSLTKELHQIAGRLGEL
jgi:hypothetical protein